MKDSLKCFYDLHVSPSTYDFFTFLISAEICRTRRGYSKLVLFILKGPDNGFRKDGKNRTYNHNLKFLQNVILPGIALLTSCKDYFFCERDFIFNSKFDENEIFPRGYKIEKPVSEYIGKELVASKIRGDKPCFFKAPNYMSEMAKLNIKNHFLQKKIITLTARELERGNPLGTRNINTETWENISEKLNSLGYQLVIIRDTDKIFSEKKLIKNIPEIPLASMNIQFRLATYENSFLNFCKNNGPAILLLFSESNAVYLNHFDNNFNATSEKYYSEKYGMVLGSSYPMTTNNIQFKWDSEKENEILESIKYVKTKKNRIKKLNGFSDDNNLIASINVAFNHLIKCLGYNLLDEDLYLIYSLEKLRSKILIKDSFLEIINSLEGSKLEKGMVDKILDLDKKHLKLFVK